MDSTTSQSNYYSEDISLYGLFSLFLKNWLILCASGFSFAVIALIWSLNQPNIYKAETLLMPVKNDKGNFGDLSGNLGGLAAMAGVNLGDSGNDNSKLALELIKSQAFLSEFILANNLIVPIMAAKDWSPESNTLVIDEKKFDESTQTWIRKPAPPRKAIPSLQEASEVLLNIVDVEQDPKTKFVTVSIEFYSPFLAAEWVTKLVTQLNNNIREMDKNEATESIEYLKKLAEDSNLYGLRNSFSAIMEEQLKSRMLAEVRKDYVFKVVDPATPPELKSKPKRAIIVIVAGFLGGILGLIIILFRTGKQAHKSRTNA